MNLFGKWQTYSSNCEVWINLLHFENKIKTSSTLSVHGQTLAEYFT